MTFAEFVTSVRQNVFPEGYAEEMNTRHRNQIIDALIDLQRKVTCLQVDHKEIIQYADTLFNCGTTVVTAPDGFIQKVYTIADGNWCSKVFYTPITHEQMECKMDEIKECGQCFPYIDGYTDPVNGSYGAYYPYAGWDSGCRSKDGWVSLYRGSLYLLPNIQSNETVVIDWDGIQRAWNDSDDVSFDRSVQSAVEWYITGKSGGFESFDTGQYQGGSSEYAVAVAEMILECRDKNRIPGRGACFNNCDAR